MGIITMWETGFFHCIINLGNPFVSLSFWIPFIISYMIQMILMKKGKLFWTRYGTVFIGIIGIIIGECFCLVITGWDLFLYMYLEFVFIALLSGSVCCIIINKIRNKKR